MREEIQNPGAEMNDAALEGISGAGRREDYEIDVHATQICKGCQFTSGKHCSGSRGQLITYLKEHGKDSVKGYHDCPYYRP